ncbi:MAG: hypothetical protein PWQ82_1008 [Thermosediminibacterales bacterium]|nr:hypothetical protein [Thermosediminibacterales bacterium]MDK2836194.1 hypothetical protein [Thermosediminibacterales bacterium]
MTHVLVEAVRNIKNAVEGRRGDEMLQDYKLQLEKLEEQIKEIGDSL